MPVGFLKKGGQQRENNLLRYRKVLPVGMGSKALFPDKEACELGLGGESKTYGYFLDGETRAGEHGSCLLHEIVGDDLLGRATHYPIRYLLKIPGRDAQHGSIISYIVGLCVMRSQDGEEIVVDVGRTQGIRSLRR